MSTIKTLNEGFERAYGIKSVARPARSVGRRSRTRRPLAEGISNNIRKGNLKYDRDVDGYYDEDDNTYVQFQDRESHASTLGKDRQPRVSSNTWGRVWKNGKLDKQFEGPKYKVRQDVARYLDRNESYRPTRLARPTRPYRPARPIAEDTNRPARHRRPIKESRNAVARPVARPVHRTRVTESRQRRFR